MEQATLTGNRTPDPPLGPIALFLDFDGTLVDIVARPDQIQVPPSLLSTLSHLDRQLDSALALISGRSIKSLDSLVAPLRLSTAGTHGAEFRLGDGQVQTVVVDSDALTQAKREAQAFAEAYPGVLYEDKCLSFALHYRQAPEHAEAVSRCAERLIRQQLPSFQLQPGKMVVEVKPEGCHKGAAIERFLQTDPFQGKQPVYLGDDVTDEDAFRVVNRLGGLSIKVGEGPTLARARLASPHEVLRWLAALASATAYSDSLPANRFQECLS